MGLTRLHQITDGKVPTRGAIIGRKANLRDDSAVGPLPLELGLDPLYPHHQSSRSGALIDFGATRVFEPSKVRKELAREFKPDEKFHLDLIHPSAREAAEAFEKGDKNAIQKLLLRRNWQNKNTKDVEKKNRRINQEIHSRTSVNFAEPQEQRLLMVYLHTKDAEVRKRIEFTLSGVYQRNPEIFEKAIQIIEKEVSDHDQLVAAVQKIVEVFKASLAQVKFDPIAVKMLRLQFSQRMAESSATARDVFVRLVNRGETHIRGEISAKDETPLERGLLLVRRALFDTRLYPYGARYGSEPKIVDLATLTRVPERALLFVKNNSPLYRLMPEESIINTFLKVNGYTESNHLRLQRRVMTDVMMETGKAEAAHPLDSLLETEPGELPVTRGRIEAFNLYEYIRRMNIVHDQVGLAPISQHSFVRMTGIGIHRGYAEVYFHDLKNWEEVPAELAVSLLSELAINAVRLGTEDPEIFDFVRSQALRNPTLAKRLKTAEEHGKYYRDRAREMIVRNATVATVMQMLKLDLSAGGHREDALIMGSKSDGHLLIYDVLMRYWKGFVSEEEIRKGKLEKSDTTRLSDGVAHETHFSMTTSSGIKAEFTLLGSRFTKPDGSHFESGPGKGTRCTGWFKFFGKGRR